MEMHSDFVVNAPAEQAWHVIGEMFADIGEWTCSIQRSWLDGELGVGAVRSCESPGFGPFKPGVYSEKLTQFDPEAMAFTYVATEGMPWITTLAMNRWSVEAIDENRCRVRSHATLELLWWLRPLAPLLRLATKKPLREVGEELIHRVEKGVPHPRKVGISVAEVA